MITKQDVIDAYKEVCAEFNGKDFNQLVMDYYGDVNTVEEDEEIDRLNEVFRGPFRFEVNRKDDGTAEVCEEFVCEEFIEGYAECPADRDDDTCYGFNVWVRDDEIGTDGTYPKHADMSSFSRWSAYSRLDQRYNELREDMVKELKERIEEFGHIYFIGMYQGKIDIPMVGIKDYIEDIDCVRDDEVETIGGWSKSFEDMDPHELINIIHFVNEVIDMEK